MSPLKGTSTRSKLHQLLATVSATLGCLLNGLVMGYTGPALPSLMNSTDDGGTNMFGEPMVINYQEGSWIAGLVSIGCLVGSVLAGPTMDRIGRRLTLMVVTSFSFTSGFVFMLTAKAQYSLFIGRLLNGVGLGFVMATASVYIIEISSVDMRGYLGCFIQFMWSIGVLVIFVLGSFLNWWQLVVAKLSFVIPFVLGMYISPETPRWLFQHGKEKEGRAALAWLHGHSSDISHEEFKQITHVRTSGKFSLRAARKPELYKPFLISIFMMFFRNMSGMAVVIAYSNTILLRSGIGFNPHLSSVLIGVVLFLSCLSATLVLARINRKTVLIISMIGMSVSFAVLGLYFHWKENSGFDVDSSMIPVNVYHWIPCTAIFTLLFVGNGGYGTLVWVVIAEILPEEIRSIGNSVIICVAYFLGFVSTKSFVDLSNVLGESGAFWLYSSVCLVGALFTVVCVPETKGKTLQEIERYFKNSEDSTKAEEI